MFTICMTVAMLQPMMAAAVLVRQTSCSAPEIDPSMCSNGDIFMLGDRLQLGVHRCGSFGGAVAPSEAVKTGRLGAAADFDENGFDTYSYCDGDNYMYYYGTVPFDVCPMYSGDFITPGNAIEGFDLKHSCFDMLCMTLQL